MIVAKKVQGPQKNLVETPAAEIKSAGGETWLTVSGESARPLRAMVTRLIQRGEMPARLSLVAALSEEGVSYITLALAAVIAHDLAVSVCAVELNWWWPGMARLLQPAAAPASPGLSAVLAGAATLDDALLPTAAPNLTLLPAGEMDIERRPIVARGAALRETIAQLSARFDHVLLDIPAIRATSDAIPLAALGKACCLVVRQGVTPAQEIRLALDDIEHLPMLGAVLNQVRVATPAWLLKLVPQE
jgi:Mrp family chromosome partitioning ATPase